MAESEEEYHKLQLHLTSEDQVLTDAGLLLRQSRDAENANPEFSRLLAACAVLLSAAGLEQFLENAMESLKGPYHAEDEEYPDELIDAMDNSFRWKLINVPTLLSEGRVEVNRRHPHLQRLHRIISLRNTLVHRRDPYHLMNLRIPVDRTTVEPIALRMVDGTEVTVRKVHGATELPVYMTDDGKMITMVPLPTSPWRSIGVADAEELMNAVNEYVRACRSPDPPHGYGLLVERSSRRG